MGEASQILFSFQEIAEALVRKENLHSGHWGVLVKFNLGAANAPGPDGKLLPTAVIPVTDLGIQRFDAPNDLTVDASVINPAPKRVTRGTPKKQLKK